MQQIQFRCTEDPFGMPFPYFPDGTIMILVQDGVAQVVKFEEPQPPEEPMPAFAHPKNDLDLRAEALRLVLLEVKEEETHLSALTFVCPPELAEKAIW